MHFSLRSSDVRRIAPNIDKILFALLELWFHGI